MVLYKNKWIHFGDVNYQQFRDSTPLKLYKTLDHNDPERRKSYLRRAMGIRDKHGNFTYLNKESPNYYAVNFLW